MRRRPAESTGIGGSIVVLLVYVLGIRDAAVIAAMGAVIGALPGFVTFLVDHGGLRGVWRILVGGRPAED